MKKIKQNNRTKKTRAISPYINLALVLLLIFFRTHVNEALEPFMIVSLLCIALSSSYTLLIGGKEITRSSALSWFISAYLFAVLALSLAIKIIDAQHIAFASVPLSVPILLLPFVGLLSFIAMLQDIKQRK